MLKRGKIAGLFLMTFLFVFILLNLISASVSCSISSVSQTGTEGLIPPPSSTFSCQNTGNSSVIIDKAGSFFSLSQSTPINLSSGTTISNLSVIFQLKSQGSYSGSIFFSDSSPSISISLTINQTQQQTPGGIIVFPTSKVITVPQGEEKTQNILVTVPSTFPSSITIQSVDFNPGTSAIFFGDLNLGIVNPGQTIQIPVIFSGKNVQVGTYQTGLTILAINSSGQVPLPTVSLQLQVTQGIVPLTNFSFSQLPSCSLTSVDIGINQTSSLVCSRPDPNIDIIPIIDNFYLTGISTTVTSSQYVYVFKGKNLGVTIILTKFSYQNGQIGDPFNQSIRISPSGSASPGITMKFLFYQKGEKTGINNMKEGDVIIQIIDNSTESLVDSYSLYYGGSKLTNNTLYLVLGHNYEVRASAPGYLDALVNFNVTGETNYTISPLKDIYSVGDTITITAATNTSFLLNDVSINSTYTFSSAGTFILKGVKDGTTTFEKSIVVIEAVTITQMTPLEEWAVGETVTINLNKNSSWTVELIKPTKDINGNVVYGSLSTIVDQNTGGGTQIKFKIDEIGQYTVKAGDKVLVTKEIKSSFWNLLPFWGWIGSFFVLLVVVILIKNRFPLKGGKTEGFDMGGG